MSATQATASNTTVGAVSGGGVTPTVSGVAGTANSDSTKMTTARAASTSRGRAVIQPRSPVGTSRE